MGVRIRTATPSDAAAIGKVHVDTWRTTYGDIVPAAYLAGLSYSRRESVWTEIIATAPKTASAVVAETADGEVIGFANGGPERTGDGTYQGELYSIYLLESHQRRGVGRRLVSAVAQRLVDAGFSSMLVWVLEGNVPARRFYESLGGERVGSQVITIGGKDVVEVSYSWEDIAGSGVIRPRRDK